MAEIHEKNIQTIRTKINETLPFRNNQFDFVTMLAVLEHLETPESVCKEIFRILKPEGQLIITVPAAEQSLY